MTPKKLVFGNESGMTIVEVTIASALLIISLLALAQYAANSSRTTQSASLSGEYYSTLAGIDQVFKTTMCDTALAGKPFNENGPWPQPIQSGIQVGTFSVTAIPSVIPAGSPSPAAGLQITAVNFVSVVQNHVQSVAPLYQDTVQIQLTGQKVDAQGKPFPGASVVTKVLTMNLWVDTSKNQLTSQPCELSSQPDVTALPTPNACPMVGQSVSFSWQTVNATGAVLNVALSPAAPVPVVTASPTAVPSGNANYTFPSAGNYNVSLTATNTLGQSETSLPLAITVYAAPVINTFAANPSTMPSPPPGNIDFSWTTSNTSTVTLTGTLTNPIPNPTALPNSADFSAPAPSLATGHNTSYTLTAFGPVSPYGQCGSAQLPIIVQQGGSAGSSCPASCAPSLGYTCIKTVTSAGPSNCCAGGTTTLPSYCSCTDQSGTTTSSLEKNLRSEPEEDAGFDLDQLLGIHRAWGTIFRGCLPGSCSTTTVTVCTPN
jgi:hypothetical protein